MIFVIANASFAQSARKTDKPNIIFIMADDMGYGDPEVYNPDSKIPTPNMNELARKGMVFTDAHAASSVCTPSRYSFITGRYAWRSRLKSEVLWSGYDDPLIDKDEATVADILRSAGYATAVVGKWHLGINFQKPTGVDFVKPKDASGSGASGTRDVSFMKPTFGGPNDLGFDYFFGFASGHNLEPYAFMENRYTVGIPNVWREKGQSTKPGISAREVHEGWMVPGWDDTAIGPTLTEKALQFIEDNASNNRPFFLYLPATAPHRPCTPPDFIKGKSQAGERGDMVAEFDWMVGRVMKKLDELRISDNTLLVVSSDNGGTQTSDDGNDYGHASCGKLKSYKGALHEGGHRIPFIVRWPAVVKAGTTCNGLVSIMDLCATYSEILGLPAPQGDGISFLHLLKNPKAQSKRTQLVHHTFSGQFALRDGNWKFIPVRSSNDGHWRFELYDLANDPYEKVNLADSKPELVKSFRKTLDALINM